jgi:hypothetical protein
VASLAQALYTFTELTSSSSFWILTSEIPINIPRHISRNIYREYYCIYIVQRTYPATYQGYLSGQPIRPIWTATYRATLSRLPIRLPYPATLSGYPIRLPYPATLSGYPIEGTCLGDLSRQTIEPAWAGIYPAICQGNLSDRYGQVPIRNLSASEGDGG